MAKGGRVLKLLSKTFMTEINKIVTVGGGGV